jgi:adenylate cyclase
LAGQQLSEEELIKIQKTDYPESYYMPILLFIFGLLFSFLIAEVGALWGFLTLLILSVTTILADYHILFLNNYIVTIIFPIFMIFSIYVILTFYKYLTEERKKQELKGTFQKYVSPSIVNEILSHPEKVELGGRKERMTVLFSDIRGFTTFAEKLDPKVLGDFLNNYLTPMTQIIFKNNGTLDKYMGDAIMAFFGAPIHYADHAKKCCITALEMVERLHTLNKEFEKQNLPIIDIGIGINTGDMSVGNMGSDIVRSYTVMGDSVNLASRLEGINKNYGTRIIISEYTHNDVKNDFICRDLDLVRVKGKAQPVKIYELVAQSHIRPEQKDCLALFKEGYDLYLIKQFQEALDKFNSALNKVPNDGPTQLYIERCQEFLVTPPLENWDGVYEFKTK